MKRRYCLNREQKNQYFSKNSSNLRIVFITNGPGPYFCDFCDLLGKQTQLTVLYERKFLGNRDESWANLFGETYKSIYLNGKNIGEETAFCPNVIWYLEKEKYDLVVLHGYLSPTGLLAAFYMQLRKIPYVIHADGAMKKTKEKKYIFLTKRFFVSRACACMSSGNTTDDYFVYYGASKNKLYRYPFTSVHETDILPEPLTKDQKKKLRVDLGLENALVESTLVIFVGQIIFRKGIDILLKCAEQIGRKAEFLIIGGSPTLKMQQWMLKRHVKNVTFLEFKNTQEIKQYLRSADLFAFPTRNDVWGLVINEAMAAGLPIVTTDQCVAGIELIENGNNGFLISADNVDELTDSLYNMLLLSEEKLREMGENSIKKIREYNLENMSKIYRERLYEIFKQKILTNKR